MLLVSSCVPVITWLRSRVMRFPAVEIHKLTLANHRVPSSSLVRASDEFSIQLFTAAIDLISQVNINCSVNLKNSKKGRSSYIAC